MSESEPEEEGQPQDASGDDDAEFKDHDDEEDEDEDDEDSDQAVVAPGHANKRGNKNGNGKKANKKLELPRGFDADLYGLRRSVSPAPTCPSLLPVFSTDSFTSGSRFDGTKPSKSGFTIPRLLVTRSD